MCDTTTQLQTSTNDVSAKESIFLVTSPDVEQQAIVEINHQVAPKLKLELIREYFHFFQLGTSSMNSKVTGQGAAADDGDDVKKKALTFSTLNSDL